ncbi:hypothetical protein D3C81_1880800 [compost metagenome]
MPLFGQLLVGFFDLLPARLFAYTKCIIVVFCRHHGPLLSLISYTNPLIYLFYPFPKKRRTIAGIPHYNAPFMNCYMKSPVKLP